MSDLIPVLNADGRDESNDGTVINAAREVTVANCDKVVVQGCTDVLLVGSGVFRAPVVVRNCVGHAHFNVFKEFGDNHILEPRGGNDVASGKVRFRMYGDPPEPPEPKRSRRYRLRQALEGK